MQSISWYETMHVLSATSSRRLRLLGFTSVPDAFLNRRKWNGVLFGTDDFNIDRLRKIARPDSVIVHPTKSGFDCCCRRRSPHFERAAHFVLLVVEGHSASVSHSVSRNSPFVRLTGRACEPSLLNETLCMLQLEGGQFRLNDTPFIPVTSFAAPDTSLIGPVTALAPKSVRNFPVDEIALPIGALKPICRDRGDILSLGMVTEDPLVL
jgi:hypothetical protein